MAITITYCLRGGAGEAGAVAITIALLLQTMTHKQNLTLLAILRFHVFFLRVGLCRNVDSSLALLWLLLLLLLSWL